MKPPTPAEAEALIKQASRERLASDGYSEAERQASLARSEQLRILESIACYPVLNGPDNHRVCLLRAIGWQGEPWYMTPSMARDKDGWRMLDSPLEIACPKPTEAQRALHELLGGDPLEILEIDADNSDRAGLFVEERVDGSAVPGTPRLRCRYRIQNDERGRTVVAYVRYDGHELVIDPDFELR